MPKKAAIQDQPATQATTLVQASLPDFYGEALGVLAARKRKPKRVLLQEALDLLFTSYGVERTDQPDSAIPAGSTLKGA